MRKICFLLTAIILTATAFAQAPEKMSYQAVIRDASNVLVINHAIGMKISILQGSTSGSAVYVETQTPTSNANGLVSMEIGSGTVVSGTFNTIDLSNGPYFIKTETDPAGGTTYTITGTSQLLSVPYALYSKTAESSVGISSFAQFYALMPPDNAATVAPGSAIDFPQDGPMNGSDITRISASSFNLSAIGTYMINWQVSVSEAAQLAIFLDGMEVPYTVVGRATGTSQLVGTTLITTTSINSSVTVNNAFGSYIAITLTPLAGGTSPVSASLVITRLK